MSSQPSDGNVWSNPALPNVASGDAIRKSRRRLSSRIVRNRNAMIGLVILALWVLLAVFAPLIAGYDPTEVSSGGRKAPSLAHPFGTDRLGRDVLSRVLFGARISLMVGIISTSIGLVAGTLLGLVSGYYGGAVDSVLMRFVDALLAFPGILLALVVIAAIGPSIINVMLAVGVSTIPTYARVVRGSVLGVKAMSYIEAARAIGNTNRRVMFRHILPNVAAPLLVLSTLQIGSAILVGSGLSFLGLGAQPPTPEWGLMTAEGRAFLDRAWWISTFPGLAILSAVVAINLMGDGLRDVLDPRMQTR